MTFRNPRRTVLAGLVLMACATPPALAQVSLNTKRVASGLTRPLYVTWAPGQPDRIYIVEQRGSGGVANRADIRILNLTTETLNASPFLSISPVTTGSEQGLLGLAFHPDHETNGYFYVNYTATGGGAAGQTIVARYTRAKLASDPTQFDPNSADPTSAQIVLTIPQPFANHNGGWIGFGPDGYLYIATGDGGSAGDPGNRAQTITNMLLGKMLRIDVNGDDFPADPNRNYAIPAKNPFVGVTGDDEIWAYGLRNPWRPSFDRATGELYIADVGQNIWEEVSIQPANDPAASPGGMGYMGGRNYGWKCYEGDALFAAGICSDPNALIFPVHTYNHTGGACSVTGGYVYRGCAIRGIQGRYFFADYCNARIWSFLYTGVKNPPITDHTADLAPGGGLSIINITSFGEDAAGELYIVDGSATTGEVFKVLPACPGDLNGDGKTDQADLGKLLSSYNFDDEGDLNCDGFTDQSDLGILLGGFECGVTP